MFARAPCALPILAAAVAPGVVETLDMPLQARATQRATPWPAASRFREPCQCTTGLCGQGAPGPPRLAVGRLRVLTRYARSLALTMQPRPPAQNGHNRA
jgi:hypothetical protein